MSISNPWSRTCLLVTNLLLLTVPLSAHADVVTDWNAKSDEIAAQKQVPPFPHSRGMAMLHVAMFEAVNAIDRKYSPYKLNLAADRNTSKEAAAASSGYEMLLALHPDRKAELDATLAAMLAAVPEGDGKRAGIELGKTAAAEILLLRSKDGANAQETYRPPTTPGLYLPTTIPVFSTVPGVTPWVMTSPSQFRPAAPPSLTSETWTKDLNEIREIGGLNSAKRTAEQTAIGRFWFLTGPRSYNGIVRQIAIAKDMNITECARMFALVAVAANDALISVFDAKYTYNLWRPVTAIRNADQTNNSATPREASWLPLGDTPMHPEYPCAHCISSAAVSTVLEAIVGDEVREVSLTSPTAPGVTRKWTRLRDYSDEVSAARIYAGFHYRFSTEVGKDMGKKIGELTVSTQLRGMEASAPATRQ